MRSRVVAHGVVASQKPTKASIILSQPYFAFESRGSRHGAIPMKALRLQIIGMNLCAGLSVAPLTKSEVKRDAVDIEMLATGPKTAMS